MDIYTAHQRGLINAVTGEVTLPQYGTSMLIDDALMQGMSQLTAIGSASRCYSFTELYDAIVAGLIITSIPLSSILSKPALPNTISVFQAFQQGLVNPLNLHVRNNQGQFIPFEDALASGLLYPRASSSFGREGSVAKEGSVVRENMRAMSLPPQSQGYSYSYKTSNQAMNSGPQAKYRNNTANRQQSVMNGGAHMRPGVGTLPLNKGQHEQQWRQTQHREHQQSGNVPQQGIYPEPAHSPLLNGNAHFVNGKLYASRPGFKIEANGTVVNLNTGEMCDLMQAQQMNLVQQIPDDEYDHAGTYRRTNSMFNRVSGHRPHRPQMNRSGVSIR